MGLGGLFVTEPCVSHYSLQHPAAASFNYRFPQFPQAAQERKKKQKRRKNWLLLLLSIQFPPFFPEGETIRGSSLRPRAAKSAAKLSQSFDSLGKGGQM